MSLTVGGEGAGSTGPATEPGTAFTQPFTSDGGIACSLTALLSSVCLSFLLLSALNVGRGSVFLQGGAVGILIE